MADVLKIHQSLIRIQVGFITDLEMEAIVYYARPDLVLGSGFGGAIATTGGPKIQEELKAFGSAKTTEAVITQGGNLRAEFIIHAVGPQFEEEGYEQKLHLTIRNALKKAEEKGIQRLAFPAMGAGFYGVPLADCARISLETVKNFLRESGKIREVLFCLRDGREYAVFRNQMNQTAQSSETGIRREAPKGEQAASER
jgi:O-acetyl-ADP-ribose deacetylase (regulator of RNase III)